MSSPHDYPSAEDRTMSRRHVAIYQQTPDGMRRVGLFPGTGNSVREISARFHRRYPKAHAGGPLFLSFRRRLFGRIVDDSERIPMEAP